MEELELSVRERVGCARELIDVRRKGRDEVSR